MAQAVRKRLIGDRQRLAFEVAWPEETPEDLAGLGWGDVVLWFDGEQHWLADAGDRDGGPAGPVRWTWIDLVEHLGRSWRFLRFEEGPPYGLVAEAPEDLRSPSLLRSVAGRSEAEVEDAVHAFQHRHDLAAGLKGIWLPPVWLLPQGRVMRVRAGGRDAYFPARDVLEVLETFVEEVLQRPSGHLTPRRARAETSWRRRAPTREIAWRLRTGLPWRAHRTWPPEGRDPSAWWGDPLSEEGSPVMAAARLSAPLPEPTRRTLVRVVQELGPSRAEALDRLGAAAEAALDAVRERRPYEQGYALAAWLRARIGANEAPVDPQALLHAWGVRVEELPPGLDPSLDAVACWGGGKGPAVLVNPSGRHAGSPAGRRATLAHEVGHLLVDRRRHLPLVEVSGGSTPRHLEQRARAFAAELLLPRETAARLLERAVSLEAGATEMRREYGVSAEVAGWQIRNGPAWARLAPDEQRRVERWCSPRPAVVAGHVDGGPELPPRS